MHRFLYAVLLVPVLAHAQLDRIRVNMTEAEFIRSFPQAHRDPESEAYWTNTWDTLEGTSGNSLWRIVNDTVSGYSFRSLKMDGPSFRFTTVDSAKVHQLRASAMQLELGLEKKLGKPSVLLSKDLLSRPLNLHDNHAPSIQTSGLNEIYYAQWVFDDGKMIVIRISAELPGNSINAPAVSEPQRSETYELQVSVSRSVPGDGWRFMVGQSAGALFAKCPHAQPRYPVVTHLYVMEDTAMGDDALWHFSFTAGELSSMRYGCVSGQQPWPEAGLVYDADKFRAEQLLKEGTQSFGKPAVLTNNIVAVYEPSGSAVAYRKTYLKSEWKTESGSVILLFEETGGGKHGPARFSVAVEYTRVQ